MVGQKFALIHYFERNEVEIVETKHFLTKMNPLSFNGEEWNGDTQIHILWPLKKSAGRPQQKHVARVLRFGDDSTSLVPFLKAAEKGEAVSLTGSLEFGRGKRTREPKRNWPSESEETDSTSDDEQLTQRHQNKKKKTTRNQVEEDARSQLQERLDLESETDPTEEVVALRNEVTRLREEKKALRNSFRIIKELPELLGKLRHISKEINQTPVRAEQHLPTASPVAESIRQPGETQSSQAIRPTTPTPCTPKRNFMGRESPQVLLQKVFSYDVDSEGQVDLGYGVKVRASNLQFVSKSDVKKTTYSVCEVVFGREELASCSLAGKKSNAFKDLDEKPMLDENKVSAVIHFVKRMYPTAEEKAVKKIIAAKLNICQKLQKRKQTPSME